MTDIFERYGVTVVDAHKQREWGNNIPLLWLKVIRRLGGGSTS
jgi:hypothetical protein